MPYLGGADGQRKDKASRERGRDGAVQRVSPAGSARGAAGDSSPERPHRVAADPPGARRGAGNEAQRAEARMSRRGGGSIFQRGGAYWLKYYRAGQPIRESVAKFLGKNPGAARPAAARQPPRQQ